MIRALKKKHFQDYEKGSCDFQKIIANEPEARKRAKKLRKPKIEGYELPENQNPCSEMYKLMDALLGPIHKPEK